jgi:hypothetical protein
MLLFKYIGKYLNGQNAFIFERPPLSKGLAGESLAVCANCVQVLPPSYLKAWF